MGTGSGVVYNLDTITCHKSSSMYNQRYIKFVICCYIYRFHVLLRIIRVFPTYVYGQNKVSRKMSHKRALGPITNCSFIIAVRPCLGKHSNSRVSYCTHSVQMQELDSWIVGRL